jgi:hypothetical protein
VKNPQHNHECTWHQKYTTQQVHPPSQWHDHSRTARRDPTRVPTPPRAHVRVLVGADNIQLLSYNQLGSVPFLGDAKAWSYRSGGWLTDYVT